MKTAREIADFVGGTLTGNADQEIHTVGSLEHAETGALAYAEGGYLDRVPSTGASCILVPSGDFPDRTVIVVDNPRLAFARAVQWLTVEKPLIQGVHPSALVHDDAVLDADVAVGAWTYIETGARVGRGTVIFPGCYIGAGCQIGADCLVYPRAVFYSGVELGDRVVIHAGVVLGADGFGFAFDGTRYVKIPQVGRLRIASDVEIGANSCMDRGALDETVVSEGAKIDNLCQVAHNVHIGTHTIISSQSGIAGSSRLGSRVTIGGQVGIADYCNVEDGAMLGAQSGIPTRKKVPAGEVYWGSPARPLKAAKILHAYSGRLPKMAEELKRLRLEMDELKSKVQG